MGKEKKLSNFMRYLYITLASIVIVVSFAVLVNATREMVVYGLTYMIPLIIIVLTMVDGFDKYEAGKLTWQYFPGVVAILVGIAFFLWASVTVDGEEFTMGWRLLCAVFSVGLSVWVFEKPYKHSVLDKEELEQSKWGRLVKIFEKPIKESKARKILEKNLRYRLVGDNPSSGSLDFGRPIAFHEKVVMTAKEAGSVNAGQVKAEADSYIDSLVAQLELKPEKGGKE